MEVGSIRRNKKRTEEEEKEIAYIDGSSLGLYGFQIGGKKTIIRDHKMTNNTAEFMALYYLLVNVPFYSSWIVYSDSQLLVNAWNGSFDLKAPHLIRLLSSCRTLVKYKHLKIDLKWIPRERNLMGKELERIIAKSKLKREPPLEYK